MEACYEGGVCVLMGAKTWWEDVANRGAGRRAAKIRAEMRGEVRR